MRSRWTWAEPLEPDRDYLVLASDISPRSRRSTGRLFRGASATRRQLATTEGLIGFTLLARPVLKQYATISVWVDEGALAAFAESPPHGDLMRQLAPEMGGTTFVRWTITGRDGRPRWNEALERLRAAN
jgi:hypothetical protein